MQWEFDKSFIMFDQYKTTDIIYNRSLICPSVVLNTDMMALQLNRLLVDNHVISYLDMKNQLLYNCWIKNKTIDIMQQEFDKSLISFVSSSLVLNTKIQWLYNLIAYWLTENIHRSNSA